MLGEFSEQFPAGRYSIETDEELLDGMYLPAYMRGTTAMQLVADRRRPGITEPVVINPFQLDAALALDAVLASMSEPNTTSPLTASGALLAHSGERDVNLDLIGINP
jgi:hypothetical protein